MFDAKERRIRSDDNNGDFSLLLCIYVAFVCNFTFSLICYMSCEKSVSILYFYSLAYLSQTCRWSLFLKYKIHLLWNTEIPGLKRFVSSSSDLNNGAHEICYSIFSFLCHNRNISVLHEFLVAFGLQF